MLSIWQGSRCFNGVGRVDAECRRVHSRCSARSVACRVQRACCMLHARIRSLTGPAPVVPLKFCRAHDGGKAEDALRLRARGLPRRRARHALRVARCAGSRCTALLHAARAHDARRVASAKPPSEDRATIGKASARMWDVPDPAAAQARRRFGTRIAGMPVRRRARLQQSRCGSDQRRTRVFYYTAQGRGQLRVLRVL